MNPTTRFHTLPTVAAFAAVLLAAPPAVGAAAAGVVHSIERGGAFVTWLVDHHGTGNASHLARDVRVLSGLRLGDLLLRASAEVSQLEICQPQLAAVGTLTRARMNAGTSLDLAHFAATRLTLSIAAAIHASAAATEIAITRRTAVSPVVLGADLAPAIVVRPLPNLALAVDLGLRRTTSPSPTGPSWVSRASLFGAFSMMAEF